MAARPRAWRAQAVQAALAVLGLAVSVIAMIGLVRAVRVDPATTHEFRVAGRALSYPAMNVAALLVLAVALVGAVSLARMISALRRCTGDHRRFAARVDAARAEDRSVLVADELVEVRSFSSAGAEAFCAGFLRPRIYVSSGAFALLAPRELAAVVAHEHRHQRARDPLRSLIGRVLARGLFFLPVLGRLHDTGGLLAEIDADARALRASGGDAQPIAAAMVSMTRGHVDAASGVSPERVDHLLGRSVTAPLPLAMIGLALVTVSLMATVLWQALRAATISATFSLPLVSRQPCVLALAAIPALLGVIAMGLSRSTRGQSR